jgi:hypothetical protein
VTNRLHLTGRTCAAAMSLVSAHPTLCRSGSAANALGPAAHADSAVPRSDSGKRRLPTKRSPERMHAVVHKAGEVFITHSSVTTSFDPDHWGSVYQKHPNYTTQNQTPTMDSQHHPFDPLTAREIQLVSIISIICKLNDTTKREIGCRHLETPCLRQGCHISGHHSLGAPQVGDDTLP